MKPKPQIVIADQSGHHNRSQFADRLLRGNTYKDLSTVCVVPTRGTIPAQVVQSWMGLMPPMNQKFVRIFVIGMEVGAAYNSAVEQILANPELSRWKYLFTLEEDNVVAPDTLLRLYEGITKYDAVSALYWTKGMGGQPMIYGDPAVMPKNFIPQIPRPDTLQECNGLGMGCCLFRLAIFKDKSVPRPWFRTVQEYIPGVGGRSYTQDLYFYENAGRCGYKFACDTRVRVGHLDAESGIVW